MTDFLVENTMLTNAKFNIDWRKAKIVEAKIRYDFTGNEYDKIELDRHLRELAIAQNYLDVLIDKFEEFARRDTDMPIVNWALTGK